MRAYTHHAKWLTCALMAALMPPIAARPAQGQFLDYGRPGLGAGISLGGVLTQTELADAADFQVRAYLTHGLSDRLTAEVGGGYASLSGDQYLSDVGLADVRLQYSLYPTSFWSPFVYVGAGVLRYDWSRESRQRTADAEPIGWSAVVPIGAGIRYKLSNRLAIDLSGGYNHTTRDDINSTGFRSGNDVFWGIKLGIELGRDPDPDGDGLFAKAEERAGTHPRMLDSDGDGLTDGDELRLHRTDPARRDTDGDGWDDGAEIAVHHSDPRRRDRIAPPSVVAARDLTDNDAAEVGPSQAAPEPVELPEFSPLRFAFGGAVLDPAAIIELAEVCQFLARHPLATVVLRGHTDSLGSVAVNRRLSQQRADAVKAEMIAMGIDAGRIVSLGLGPEEPIAANDTAAGRRLNRRVEVVVIDGAQASSL